MTRFAPLAFSVLFAVAPVCAQPQTVTEDPGARSSIVLDARLVSLLNYDCGAAEVKDRFRLAIAESGPRVQPQLLSVLIDGAPEKARTDAERALAKRYRYRQKWLEDEGQALFGADEVARLAGRTRGDFIADGLRRLDLRYRQNAAIGLGVVGGQEALAPLRRAANAMPEIKAATSAAISEIGTRLRRGLQ